MTDFDSTLFGAVDLFLILLLANYYYIIVSLKHGGRRDHAQTCNRTNRMRQNDTHL